MPYNVDDVRFIKDWGRLREDDLLPELASSLSRAALRWCGLDRASRAGVSSSGGVALVKLKLKGRRGIGRTSCGPSSDIANR